MRRLAAVLLLLLAAPPARAEVHHAESLESLVDKAPHIAIAEVTATRDTIPAEEGAEPGMSRPEHRITEVRIAKALKGKPPGKASFDAYRYRGSWPKPAGTEMLLLLDEAGQVSWGIDLADKEWCKAYSMDFQVLRGREALLAAVEARIRSAPPTPAGRTPRPLVLDVPEGTDAHKDMFAGSACFLTVPPDPPVRKRILAQAGDKDPWVRARGAWNLLSYPDEETKGILRALLKDPGESRIERGGVAGQLEMIPVWPARQAAYDVLRLMGEQPETPRGYRDDLDPAMFER